MKKKRLVVWTMVSEDLKTQAFRSPRYGTDAFLWICREPDTRYEYMADVYSYHLFNANLDPLQLKSGGFTCLDISDFKRDIGYRIYYSIKVEISDRNNVVRHFTGFGQTETGIIGVIEFLRTLSVVYDWDDYNLLEQLRI